MTGKIEEKKSLARCVLSLHSFQSSYLEGARAHKVPAQEIIRFYLHLTDPTILKRNLRDSELPYEGYQTGSLSHCGWEGIPETCCIREKAAFIIVTGSWDLSVLSALVEFLSKLVLSISLLDVDKCNPSVMKHRII